MVKNYFKFNGISSKDLGLVIQTAPTYAFPQRDVETKHVAGRNGDLLIDNDCWNNVDRSYSVGFEFTNKDSSGNISPMDSMGKVVQWLTTARGYCRLEDTYDPDVYRLASFYNDGSFTNYFDQAAAISLTFDCKPQRFLKSGDEVVEFSAGSEVKLTNPTDFAALPLIKFNNLPESDGVVIVSVTDNDGGVVSSISLENAKAGTDLILDSEMQRAYDSDENDLNSNVGLNGADFPKLKAGTTTVSVNEYKSKLIEIDSYKNVLESKQKALIAEYKPYSVLLEDKQDKVSIPSYSSLINSNQDTYECEAYSSYCKSKAEELTLPDANTLLEGSDKIYSLQYSTKEDVDSFVASYGNSFVRAFTITIEDSTLKYEITYLTTYIPLVMSIANRNYGFIKYEGMLCNPSSTYTIDESAKILDPDKLTSDDKAQIFIIAVAAQDSSTYSSDNYICVSSGMIIDILSYKLNGVEQLSGSSNVRTLSWFAQGSVTFPSKHLSISNNYIWKLDYSDDCPTYLSIYFDISDTVSSVSGTTITGVNYGSSYIKNIYYVLSADVSYVYIPKSGLFSKASWVSTNNSEYKLSSYYYATWKKSYLKSGSLSLSTDSETTYYVLLGDLPQYESETTTVTNSDGVATTEVLNKVHFTIGRTSLVQTSYMFLEAIDAGYYKIISSDGTYDSTSGWSYISEGGQIPTGLTVNSGFIVYYLEKKPSYSDAENFPTWLNPEPVLYDSNKSQTSGINASYINFNVTTASNYRYTIATDDGEAYVNGWRSLSSGGLLLADSDIKAVGSTFYACKLDELPNEYPNSIKFTDESGSDVSPTDAWTELTFPQDSSTPWVKVSATFDTDGSISGYKFTLIQNGILKWDTNTAWVSMSANDEIVSSTSTDDTSIFYLDELKEYAENEYYTAKVESSATSNPTRVYFYAKKDGYYKYNSGVNWKYYSAGDLLISSSPNFSNTITYLEEQNNDFSSLKISITPRWWKL